MEFIVNTDLEKELPSVIDFNFEEMKTELAEKLTHYNSLVVTEDSIKAAKGDKALLNKLKDAIDGKRKEVKRLCLAPYEDFEKKCKELISMIDSPVRAIDTQIKVFDDIKQTEKYAELQACYNEIIGEYSQLIPIEKVINSKWRNAGEKVESLVKEMQGKITKAVNDLKIISAFTSKFETVIKEKYLENFDMSDALALKNHLEEKEIELEAMKAQEEKRGAEAEAKRLQENEQKAQEQVPQPQPIQAPIQEQKPVNEPVSVSEQTKTIKVIFYDTTEAFRKDMKALTEKHNISYGGLK